MLSTTLCFLVLCSPFWVPSSALSSYEPPFWDIETYTWSNNDSITDTIVYDDGSLARLILKTEGNDSIPLPPFGCGFICPGNNDTCFFAVVLLGGRNASVANRQVWVAKGENPIRKNGTLEFTAQGGLVLGDPGGTKVWSTGTPRNSIVGIRLRENGDLQLYSKPYIDSPIWDSFAVPSDTLLPRQKLYPGIRLVASASAKNLSRGKYYVQLTSDGVSAFVQADLPLEYLHLGLESSRISEVKNCTYGCRGGHERPQTFAVHYGENLEISIGRISFSHNISRESAAGSYHYLRLGFDGHLRTYRWQKSNYSEEVYDLLTQQLDNCQQPDVCGDYGICNGGGKCICPKATINGGDYFKQIEGPSTGPRCSENVNFSCQSPLDQHHQLVNIGNLSYFSFIDSRADDPNLRSLDACKKACLNNCNCRAAFFKYGGDTSDGKCYLLNRILSIRANPIPGVDPYNSFAFIKLQIPYSGQSPHPGNRTASPPQNNHLSAIISGSVAVGIVLFLVAMCLLISKKRRKKDRDEPEEYFGQVLTMPQRFSYEKLSAATGDFQDHIGGGGFGTVFKGELKDGTSIAVKRLDNRGQGMKEFLAEFETIGNVNHLNLVRLVGFCADRSRQLLVYEYMSNGSLDKWIFNSQKNMDINWPTRKKIILDVARGLTYLHEECRQRIVHLDIKPQNILLDNDFNAKVSDFGLSKLMARDQSQVETNMRGTPGYLAPEWQQLRITLKVDVYSFGIVVLEIICGRRNLDRSQSETSMHLLRLLQEKAEANHLIDIIQNSSMDTQLHEDEVLKMIKLAAWCLQDDHTRRPQMSMVVKVLEGAMEIEPNISFRFCNALARSPTSAVASEPPQASVLSAPR